MPAYLERLARVFRKAKQPGIADGGNYLTILAREKGSPETFNLKTAEALPFRSKPIPFEIEIPTVRVEDYIRTREAVEAVIEGVFIAQIRSVSIENLLAEDFSGRERRFNHSLVNFSKIMRYTLPPEMEVFIDPNAVRIEGSNRMSTDEQKAMIAQASANFKKKLPEGVRGFVRMRMVDPSTISQLEAALFVERNKLLLPDFFARTDVKTIGGKVADIGRLVPTGQRIIRDWDRRIGLDTIFAVPVGVLPRKLTA